MKNPLAPAPCPRAPRPRSTLQVWPSTGLPGRRGSQDYLTGQTTFIGLADTIEGVLVIDEFLAPPFEIGRVKTPMRLSVREGLVVRIEGGGEADPPADCSATNPARSSISASASIPARGPSRASSRRSGSTVT